MLERLLDCMGYRLEVIRRPVEPVLTRSEQRSWRLHRQLSTHLTQQSLRGVAPADRGTAQPAPLAGDGPAPHPQHQRWGGLLGSGDVSGLRRVLTGLDRDSIEMREVSPMGGLLSQEERQQVLADH